MSKDELVSDKAFNVQMDIMLTRFYYSARRVFVVFAIEYRDFKQEMWCRLFEEKTFNGDIKLSMVLIRHNAYDFIRDLRNRQRIARFQPYKANAYYDHGEANF